MRGAAVVAVLLVLKTVAMAESQEEGTEYTNTWVVEIKGGEEEAQRVAKDLGFTYSGKAKVFDDHYLLKKDDHPEISKKDDIHLTNKLSELDQVKFAEQQTLINRVPRVSTNL